MIHECWASRGDKLTVKFLLAYPSDGEGVIQPYLSWVLTRDRKASSAVLRLNSLWTFVLRHIRPWPFTKLAANCMRMASMVYAEAHPRGVSSSIQMAPPSITKPFSILGSTTRINGGAKGKLSGKIRWRRMLGTLSSSISWASGDSGSRWKSRTCHSNKLSSINSACKVRVSVSSERKQSRGTEFQFMEIDRTYRKDFLAAAVLRFLQLSELFHQAFGSDGGIDFRSKWQLRLAAIAGRDCTAKREPK